MHANQILQGGSDNLYAGYNVIFPLGQIHPWVLGIDLQTDRLGRCFL